MSSERANNTNRPLKPSFASTRTARPPLTPRIGGNGTPSVTSATSRQSPSVRSEPSTPRGKQTSTPLSSALANGNVTPRSSARKQRVDGANTSPAQAGDTPNATRPKAALATSQASAERNGTPRGLGIGVGILEKARVSRPKSVVSDVGSIMKAQSPLVRPPTFADPSRQSTDESIGGRFFHASDAPTAKPDPAPKKTEAKKAQFFHADGQQVKDQTTPAAPSSVLSTVSEKRSSGPWVRSDNASTLSRSPPLLSPGLSAFSGNSPLFTPAAIQATKQRSPSPSKENVHLSYRKGVSQIFGTRPTPRAVASNADLDESTTTNKERLESIDSSPSILALRQNSLSLSSIDSVDSQQSRRRSTTTVEAEPSPSPLAYEIKAATVPRVPNPANNLPSIDTSLQSPPLSKTESAFSPTKGVPELAADARRERKVLDLEISNSSLLAINASLEREIRRQKAELKRFRRLSRAGRFSLATGEHIGKWADGLSAVGEEDEGDDIFGLPSGDMDMQDDFSDDEESLASSSEALSPSVPSRRESDRLAKDEKRLQVDLEKHKELLAQSQAMNQSLKRCMYATEDMVREGRKALDYQVRVSDVKLGGRVLSTHDDEDEDGTPEIEVEDETLQNDSVKQAKEFLETWASVERPSFESSEAGDRDSGIEADRPPPPVPPKLARKFSTADDLTKLPGEEDQRPFYDQSLI